MPETWPPGLPKGWQLGTPLKVDSGVNRTPMLSGHVRQRVALTLPFDQWPATLVLDDAEFRVFEYFMRDVLSQEDWYTGPYHDGGGIQTGTLRLVGGEWKADQDPETGVWTITAKIEIDSRK